MNVVFLILIITACCCFYLGLAQQKLLPRSLNKKFAQVFTLLLVIAAVICGLFYFSVGTSIFALLVIAMLAFSVLPFVALLKKETPHDH